jgi:hypothetical protein
MLAAFGVAGASNSCAESSVSQNTSPFPDLVLTLNADPTA